jgi:arabinan endo-1,5-alpha-L-arabinosidase
VLSLLAIACGEGGDDGRGATPGGAGAPGGASGAGAGAAAGGAGSGGPPPGTGGAGGASGRASAGSGGAAGSSGAAGSAVAGTGAGGNAGAGQAGSAAGRSGAGAGGSAGAGGAGGDDDRCDIAVLDPAQPPRTLTLSGNLGTHDPALIESDGVFYLWQTGLHVPAKTSTDLMQWQGAPAAFSANPAWVAREVPEAEDLWAPDVSFFGGKYHLYYSASSFTSNYSCIGHATRDSLASGSWSDHGQVVCSNHGSNDDWNAIDPNVVVDRAGTPWLAFGSFWGGIKMIELDQSGARANDDLHALARRDRSVEGAVEAPFIVRRCGYYYLFVSFDKCCAGSNSTYNVRVGRSENVTGPYVDKAGVGLMQGGGSLLIEGDSRWRGPGHPAVLFSGERGYIVYHAYDSQQNGAARLRTAELVWDAAGWPVTAGP